jgi:hypothetical protein
MIGAASVLPAAYTARELILAITGGCIVTMLLVIVSVIVIVFIVIAPIG